MGKERKGEEDQMIVRCLHCGVKNRIPRVRLHDRPACGNCRAPLDEMIIRCLRCGAKNRMPENRVHDRPLCGACKTPLVICNAPAYPVEVNDQNFSREVLGESCSVLVDCWAPWCGPCKTMEPVMEDLASKYGGGVKVAKLNVDENPLTASQYAIRSIPTLLFFRGGVVVQRLVGAQSKEAVEEQLLATIKTN
jgi:thioredoxin 2